MATLNIKDFPDPLYEALKVRAGAQHRSIAQEVTHILSEVLTRDEPISIFDLQGLERGSGREWTQHATKRKSVVRGTDR